MHEKTSLIAIALLAFAVNSCDRLGNTQISVDVSVLGLPGSDRIDVLVCGETFSVNMQENQIYWQTQADCEAAVIATIYFSDGKSMNSEEVYITYGLKSLDIKILIENGVMSEFESEYSL